MMGSLTTGIQIPMLDKGDEVTIALVILFLETEKYGRSSMFVCSLTAASQNA